MPNPATVRERRLRKTKAQLIDEIDTLEQRAAAIEATYVSTQTDVTDLKRAEEALRESQQLLGTLVDNIPAVVFFRDLDGRAFPRIFSLSTSCTSSYLRFTSLKQTSASLRYTGAGIWWRIVFKSC